ncbi:MAG: glutamate-1-semialdehyde 2,1-aminomutase, partial [Candidatus Latescibacterota bacterium]
RAFRSVHMDPVFIESGCGSRITDVDGNEYIDYVGSWGPLILGHARGEVVAAILQAAERGTSFGAPTGGEIQLAQKIIEMVPSVEMVRLVNSGTEATMSAVRLARGYTGRDKIIKFEGCYHGHGDSFLIKAGSGAMTLGQPSSPGVPAGSAADTISADYNDIDSVRDAFAAHTDQIAAVIIEPIAGNMGVIPADRAFLMGLRELCNQSGAVLIFDEVMSGFRVHPGGAQSLYSIMPDLTTMGKVIGGGMPVGAYGGKKEIMQMVAPAGPVYQAGTLSGNPLAVAAGLQTLRIISQDGFYEELNSRSNDFFGGIATLIKDNNLPLSLNYVNSMGCVYFKPGGVRSYSDAMQSDTAMFSRYFAGLLQEGIYIAPSQYEALFVSAAHSEDDLSATLHKMSDILLSLLR